MKLFNKVILANCFLLICVHHTTYGSLDALLASLHEAPATPATTVDAGVPESTPTAATVATMPTPDSVAAPTPVAESMPVPKSVVPVPEAKAVEPKIVAPKAPMPEAKTVSEPKVGMPAVVPVSEPEEKAPVAATVQTVDSTDSGQVEISNVHAVTTSGLNTLNIDSAGNWLEKRIWYKKAEQLFEEIRAAVQKASDNRMKFVHEVNTVGKQIDDFYETVGLQEGKIEELLKAVLQDLDIAAQYRGGDLSSTERALKAKIQAEQKQIESIGKDVKLIDDLDEQIDKTMMKAFKEIDTCRGLETRAWNNFKDIGNELDDKKARVLYYEMDNFYKNIEQKMTYLQSNLLPYLQSKLVGKVTETISQIKTNVQALQKSGVDLYTLLQKDEKGDLLILKQRDKEQETIAEGSWEKEQTTEEKEAAALKEKKKKSREQAAENVWYRRIATDVFGYAHTVWGQITDWILILVCCFKCLVCKIQELFCRLIGS